MRCKLSPVILTLLTLLPADGRGQSETLLMAVLNSRRHGWSRTDNPVVGLFVSTDRGRTWVHRGWKEYVRTFYVEAGPDGTIWSACGNGVHRSTDQGKSWRVTTGWEVTEVLRVDVDPRAPAHVFAATPYGVFRTTDRGGTWEKKITGFKRAFTSDVTVDRARRGVVFAATEEGIYRSTNGGDQWSIGGLEGKGIRCIVQDPAHSLLFWAGTEEDGVFLSTDGGSSWNQRSEGLEHKTVYAVCPDPSGSGVVMCGTFQGGVYTSANAGGSWQRSSDGLGNMDVHALVMLPSDPSIVFAGTLNGGLFQSTNGGKTWEFNSQEESQVWGLSVRHAGPRQQ